MNAVLKDDTELFKQFSDNESFRRWLSDSVFNLTYEDADSVGRRLGQAYFAKMIAPRSFTAEDQEAIARLLQRS